MYIYYRRYDHLKSKRFTVSRMSNFVVFCFFFVSIDWKEVKISIPPFWGQGIQKFNFQNGKN